MARMPELEDRLTAPRRNVFCKQCPESECAARHLVLARPDAIIGLDQAVDDKKLRLWTTRDWGCHQDTTTGGQVRFTEAEQEEKKPTRRGIHWALKMTSGVGKQLVQTCLAENGPTMLINGT